MKRRRGTIRTTQSFGPHTRFYFWLYARCIRDHARDKILWPDERTEFEYWWAVYGALCQEFIGPR